MRFQLILAGFIQVLALVLANAQGVLGVRTDEAKYLLDIPYPHPPLARGIFHFFEWLPFQEGFIRIVLATLLLQAVWLLWDACRDLHPAERFAVAITWLFSAALIIQAGTLMMAPLTALGALIFVWAERRITLVDESRWMMIARLLPWKKHTIEHKSAILSFGLALVWITSLFSAFHIVLFLPLVWRAFAHLRRPLSERLLYIVGPLVVVALYTLGHPLILASFTIQATKDASFTLLSRFTGVVWLWILAGSAVGTLVGVAGIVRWGSWALRASAVLVFVALLGAQMEYYAILPLPLLVGGLMALFSSGVRIEKFPYTVIYVACSVILIALTAPWFSINPAAAVSQEIQKHSSGTILIVGSFGHQWQYQNRQTVHRYSERLLPNADAVVCLAPCQQMGFPGFRKLSDLPKEF